MENLSLKIIFPNSRSKLYGRVLKLAREFENFKPGDPNEVLISREKELVEKWEFFNLLFWRVVDWKGSAIEFDGQRYQAHTDKTRIFYSLQMDHTNHICSVVDKIKEVRRIFNYSFDARLNDKTILN